MSTRPGSGRSLAIEAAARFAFSTNPARAGVGERLKRAAAAVTSDRPLPGRLLIYTWGGNGQAKGWFDNPYLKGFSKMKILRGPEAPLGQWIEERVDLVADHQEAFGYPPTRPTELSLSCDSDDTKVPVAGAVADVAFRKSVGARSRVVQAVCSPFRNDLDRKERRVLRFCASRAGRAVGQVLSASAGIEDPGIRWRVTDGPYFDNQVATLRFRGRGIEIDIDKTVAGGSQPGLERVCRRALT